MPGPTGDVPLAVAGDSPYPSHASDEDQVYVLIPKNMPACRYGWSNGDNEAIPSSVYHIAVLLAECRALPHRETRLANAILSPASAARARASSGANANEPLVPKASHDHDSAGSEEEEDAEEDEDEV